MKNSRRVLTVVICVFVLSLAACFLAALYVNKTVGDGLFAVSSINGTAAFSKKDIDFLERENYDFTFAGRWEEEAYIETAKTRAEVVGTNADYAGITGMKVISGSFFNDFHVKKLSNVVVLNNAAAWRLFGSTNCVGNNLGINGKQYQVIGVVESDFENGDNVRIFLPFEVFEKELPECNIYEIFVVSESESVTETLIKDMGYAPEDFQMFDLDKYKAIMMQRVRIIVFLSGLCAVVYLFRMCLLNIKAISREAKRFSQSNYASDIWLFVRKKSFLFELVLLAGKLLLIFLVMNIIKFKLCLPYYFFSMKGLNYSTLVDLLRFFTQPFVSIPALGYLNGLNLVSNVMFFTSMLSGTVILSVHILRSSNA